MRMHKVTLKTKVGGEFEYDVYAENTWLAIANATMAYSLLQGAIEIAAITVTVNEIEE